MTRRTNPIPQLIPLRARRAKERVDELLWTHWQDVAVMGGPVNPEPLPLDAGQRQPLTACKPGEHFGPPGGGWQQRWFKVEVPEPAPNGSKTYLHWLCEGEATAYIDGRPWAGLDFSHRTCVLPAGSKRLTIWIDHGTYATGIAPTKTPALGKYGCRFDGARLAKRNDVAWKVGWDLDVFLQLATQLFADGRHEVADNRYGYQATLDKCSPLLRLLLQGLDDACEAFDHEGLSAFSAALDALYARIPAESWQPLLAVCPQTHIDLVWLWPENEAERKSVHSMATMMRLLDAYPDFVFSASQPAMYRAIERRAPSLSREIEARIAEGRWEATGAFEVEPDTQLPSGEALARSLAIGQRKLAALYGDGRQNRLCWLPDVFGYATCLPQMLRLAGVDRFFTTKLRWSAITKFPYQSFVWRGGDGSEVLAQISTIGYTGVCEVEPLVTSAREFTQFGVHDEFMLAQGLGDGGGGPTEAMLERTRRFANLAGVPRARFALAEDFFERLEASREKLPVFQGELYLEYHRGTYTTQSEFKRLYRRLESAVQTHEAVRVATGGGPIDERVWQRLAFAQFHDAIPGSSIGLVYEQLSPELRALADDELAAADGEISAAHDEDDEGMWAFNPLPLPRRVHLDRGGKAIVVDLPALGGARIDDAGHVPPRIEPMRVTSAETLDNGLLRASFDGSGRLVRLEDRGEALDLVEPAGLSLYVDQPAKFGAWDIDHQALRRGTAIDFFEGLTVADQGPLRGVLVASARVGERSRITIRYILEAGCPWLRVETSVDWREDHRLLKYHLRTGYRGRFARFGAPFGQVLRPQHAGTQAEEAMWEVCGSRWAAVTDDDGRGVAIVTEAKYGFSCRDGDLGLSLLRAPADPDPKADRGVHEVRFALGAHRCRSTAEVLATPAAADALFAPVLQHRGPALASTPPVRTMTNGPTSLTPAWALPAAGGGFVLRLHETNGERGTSEIEVRDATATVDLVDFLEAPLPDQSPLRRVRERVYAIGYKPYQILSLRVRPS